MSPNNLIREINYFATMALLVRRRQAPLGNLAVVALRAGFALFCRDDVLSSSRARFTAMGRARVRAHAYMHARAISAAPSRRCSCGRRVQRSPVARQGLVQRPGAKVRYLGETSRRWMSTSMTACRAATKTGWLGQSCSERGQQNCLLWHRQHSLLLSHWHRSLPAG